MRKDEFVVTDLNVETNVGRACVIKTNRHASLVRPFSVLTEGLFAQIEKEKEGKQ
jgi:hypothetical protein